jgi:hypothetical protein
MPTLRNHLIAVQAPIGVIPDLASNKREGLAQIARFFDSMAGGMEPGRPGDARVVVTQGSTDAAATHAYGTVALATAVAGTVVEVNGVKFTAISGTPRVANNEFDISGADAADATSLALALRNSSSAGIRGVVEACNLALTATLATVLAGDTIKIDGQVLTAVEGAPGRLDRFDISGTDAEAATSLAAVINAHPYLSRRVLAVAASDVVTLRQIRGTTAIRCEASSTITLSAAATAAVSTVLITSLLPGVLGNGLTIKTLGVAANATLTCATVVATNTVVINGQALTAIQQRATGTLTCSGVNAGDTCSINGVTFTARNGASGVGFPNGFDMSGSDTADAADLVTQINAHPSLSGVVTATNAAGVVTVRAVTSGTAGNAITLAGTAVRLAASAATLENGLAVANNQFDVSPGSTNAQVAEDLARAINASTTALISGHVRATWVGGSSAVVNVYAINPGIPGNAVTLSTTGGTITASAARLAGGTTASAEGAAASGTITISGGSGNYTATINGVATGNVAWNTTDAQTATDLAAAINALATLAADHVQATAAAGVVTVTATRGGVQGNAITLAGTGTGATVSGARLTGGAAPTTVVPSAARLASGVGGDGTTAYSYPP